MFKATPDGKHLVELSLKQREQFVQYKNDKKRRRSEDEPLPVEVKLMATENLRPKPSNS